VVLGEIESPDPVRYRYILALVKEGEAQPSFYVTCEKNPRAKQSAGSYRLRVISAVLDEEIESSDRFADWMEARAAGQGRPDCGFADLDVFCDEALKLSADMLGLAAAPERLM
jgi:hypothetical protein